MIIELISMKNINWQFFSYQFACVTQFTFFFCINIWEWQKNTSLIKMVTCINYEHVNLIKLNNLQEQTQFSSMQCQIFLIKFRGNMFLAALLCQHSISKVCETCSSHSSRGEKDKMKRRKIGLNGMWACVSFVRWCSHIETNTIKWYWN